MEQKDFFKITQEQRELLSAVEQNDTRRFIMLGGASKQDINFTAGENRAFLLLIAAARGFTDMVELMALNVGLNLLQTDANGLNAFLMASWHNRVEVMQKLIKLNCNVFCTANNGSTALHLAVKQGHIEAVREIL